MEMRVCASINLKLPLLNLANFLDFAGLVLVRAPQLSQPNAPSFRDENNAWFVIPELPKSQFIRCAKKSFHVKPLPHPPNEQTQFLKHDRVHAFAKRGRRRPNDLIPNNF